MNPIDQLTGPRNAVILRSDKPTVEKTNHACPPPQTQVKTCTKCRRLKPLTEFYGMSKAVDGRQAYCKDCQKAHSRDRVDKQQRERLAKTFGVPTEELDETTNIIRRGFLTSAGRLVTPTEVKPARKKAACPEVVVQPAVIERQKKTGGRRRTKTQVRIETLLLKSFEDRFRSEHSLPESVTLDLGEVLTHYLNQIM